MLHPRTRAWAGVRGQENINHRPPPPPSLPLSLLRQVHAAGRPLVSLSAPAAFVHAAMLPPAATGADWVLAVSGRVAVAGAGAGAAAPPPCSSSSLIRWAFRFASPRDGEAAAASLAALRVKGGGGRGAGAAADAAANPPSPPPPLARSDMVAAVATLLASPGFEACVAEVVREVVGGAE